MLRHGVQAIDSSTRKPLGLSVPQMAVMSRLLDEALDLDAAGRDRWLATLPPEHRELAPMLREALLPASTQAEGIAALATLPNLASITEPDALDAPHLQPGLRVGPYELIRSLGSGGMAQVWLARRADGAFRREVALKLPVQNTDRADLADRFARERDILASLEHPNIARFYDAGLDAGGLPYLSMEYVQGESLTDWCDTRQLRIAARLELFLQVLEAVQYAHEKQVIHRDLKPSNILVTQSGQVRLLDFGVAKLLEVEGPDQAQLTAVHGRALTPEYASPELLHGDPIDERSDVYSLGVLLYELLCGKRPYQLSRAASLGLLERAMATAVLEKPSLQLTPPAALVRAANLEKLTRQLRGDLDAIALRAMAKEPALRYLSVLALAQDLQRHLNGQPVQAQGASVSYRAGKLIQRHKVAVAAISAAMAVALGLIGYTLRRDNLRWTSVAVTATGGRSAAAAPGVPVVAGARASNLEPGDVPFMPLARSVAVLPFVDMSENRDQEYFSDGLTEELLNRLAKIPALRVIARTSSFSFKGKSDDIPTIAKQLNVANILEGSVRKSGHRLRVTTRLIRAASGEEIWSETYDRELKDVFQVQDQIAAAVISALEVQLVPRGAASNTHRTSNTEAYNQFLLGRQFYDRATLEGSKLAANAYRKAIELDPGYAAAYAGLAMADRSVATFSDAAVMLEAVAAADKAVALGPDEADGYVVRGDIRVTVNWDWAGAKADLEKALSYDPGDSSVRRKYGQLLAYLGRLPEGIAVLKQATDSDPLSARAWRTLSHALAADGQMAAAGAALRRALEVQPESLLLRYSLGRFDLAEGRASQALAAFRGVDSESLRLSGLAMAEHSLGRALESQQFLDELIARDAEHGAYQIAQVYAWRGEKDRAFEWLERAYRQHDSGLIEIKTELPLASLRGDARYAALLAKIHLS
jgi:serine/threonine protein kinase/TolB-like protein/Tfp pilus assembly protein PilF